MSRAFNVAGEVTADISDLTKNMQAAGDRVRDFNRRARNESHNFDRSMQQNVRSSGAFGRGVQNAAFQVGDFAVQVGGGTSAVRAMSMQLPQLLGGFGVLGAVAGAAVAIIGPLAQSLFDTEDASKAASKAIDDFASSVTAAQSHVRELASLQETLNEAHRAQAGASAAGAKTVISNTKAEYNARKQLLGIELEIIAARRLEAETDIKALQASIDARRQQARQTGMIMPTGTSDFNRLPGTPRVVTPEMIRGAAGFDDAVERRRRVEEQEAENIRNLRRMRAEMALASAQAAELEAAMDRAFGEDEVSDGGAAGGGGGGRRSPRVQQIEGIKDAMEEATAGLPQTLDEWKGFFGDMEGAFQQGGSRLLKISKAFGAAQALISAYQGAAKALTLPFPANMAAYAQVLATGLGAVSAIKGVTEGGNSSGGAASGVAAAPAQSNLQAVNISMTGEVFGRQQVVDLIGKINEAVDGGARIRLA